MTTLVYNIVDDLRRQLWGKANQQDIFDALNIALNNIGYVTQIDTSLTVVDDQLSYDLPSTTTQDEDTGVFTTTSVRNIVRVQVATSDSGDYDYETVYNWREMSRDLKFDKALKYTAGRTIRLFYNAPHDSISSVEHSISDQIPKPLLTATAAYYYYLKKYADGGTQNKHLADLLAEARRNKTEAEMKYMVSRMVRDPILGS